jgi:hypothetical protein
MHHVLRTRLTAPAVAGQLERGVRPQRGKAHVGSFLWHSSTNGLADGNAAGTEAFKAMDVDAQVVWRYALAVEGVDATNLAEEVASCLGVELVLSQALLARKQLELALVNLDHQCVLLLADRAITHRELGEVGFDLEAHCATVTGTAVGLKRT